MIDINLIKNNSYSEVVFERTMTTYRGYEGVLKILCCYDDAFKQLKCVINFNINGQNGEVSIEFSEEKQNLIIFSNLYVPSCISSKGIGTLLMNEVFEIANDIVNYYCLPKNEIMLKGWLSSIDFSNGNWKNSLPLYEKVGKMKGYNVIFKTRSTGKEYTTAADYLKYSNGEDGDIVYTAK